jgi:D-alanine-D-alanine ligase
VKVAIIYNKDIRGVINTFGMQNREFYNEATVQRVAHSLEKAGHNVAVLDGNKQIIERIENFMPRVVEGEQMGMVFNMAYGIQGESRYTHIPAMLEMLGLPYVGSSPSGHALALDKVLTKIIWKNNRLSTPDFWVFSSPDEDMSKVQYPVIVKPKMESVSFGLKVTYQEKELREAIREIVNEYEQQALVEQFIPGREFCVGLLGNSPVETFPVLEIDLEGNPDAIQTLDDKQNKPRRKICPADIPKALAEKMQKISIEAFQALNLRDFARVDIRLDAHDNIYLLEINSMASLGETGSYPTAARVAGYTFESLVNRMLDVASVRYFTNQLPPGNRNGKGKLSQPARMRTFIKSRQQQTEKFLRKLVDTNSHVRNLDGVNHCGELISYELSQLGFIQQIYPQLEVGNMMYFTNSYNHQVDYLLLMPIDNEVKLARHEHYREHEQYLEGTGIWEKKGGVAVVVSALQSLRFIRNLKKIKIGILLTTDSTIDGRYSRNLIQEKATRAKKVIALSGSSKEEGLVLSRSGSALYRFEMKLVNKEHSENVASTAYLFNKTLAGISSITGSQGDIVIAPYDIRFHSNIFKKYAYGSAGISVRYNSPKAHEVIEDKLKKIIRQQKSNKNIQVLFEGGQKRPPMEKSRASEAFYEEILSLTRLIDVRVTKEHRWSSTDICHIETELPRIDGLGPVGEYLLHENERIIRHSLSDRALLLAMILGSETGTSVPQSLEEKEMSER